MLSEKANKRAKKYNGKANYGERMFSYIEMVRSNGGCGLVKERQNQSISAV